MKLKAIDFVIDYYKELNAHGQENEALKKKERDRDEIFKRAHKGDIRDRQFTKNHIRQVLTDKDFRLVKEGSDFQVTKDNIDQHLNSESIDRDYFRLLMYHYEKSHGENALIAILRDLKLKEDQMIIKSEATKKLYKCQDIVLTYEDKLDILVQKIYEYYKGIQVIDSLLYQKIEEVQVGTSGEIHRAHEAIWVIVEGKIYHLKCLKLEDKNALERVCKQLASEEKLDTKNPYAFSFGLDGSRRVVYREGYAESYTAFIRKFDTVQGLKNEALLSLSGIKNYELLVLLEKIIMKGSLSTIVIGDQGSGKTTKTVRLMEYVYDDLGIRSINNNFETFMRNLFPNKNILEMRAKDGISETEVYESSLKSSGQITFFTEIRENHMIDHFNNSGRRGSKMAITSMHHNEASHVVYELAKGLMKEGLHNSIASAIEDILGVLKIVIEIQRNDDGKRVYNIYELENRVEKFDPDIYLKLAEADALEIERIKAKALVSMAQPVNYSTTPLVVYDDLLDAYVKKNDLSDKLKSKVLKSIRKRDQHLLEDYSKVGRSS